MYLQIFTIRYKFIQIANFCLCVFLIGMNILPVTLYSRNYGKNPNFTSCTKIYNPKSVENTDIFSGDKVMTTTGVFRYDLDWDRMMKYIFWNFLNEEKINIWSLACSDGSEPLSYALYLHNKAPESFYSKYIPIYGCDIDPEMIKLAKSGKINLSDGDFHNMKKYIKNPNLYFTEAGAPMKIHKNIDNHERSYIIDPYLTDMMTFEKSDILTQVKKIKKDENYVINIRNVFPYMSENYRNEVLETLAKNMKRGNIFVFGHYDHLVPNFRQKLSDLGFFEPFPYANFVQKM